MKKIFIIIAVIFFNEILFSQESEYILKAAFIEKFCRFTEWPTAKIDTSDFFNITVFGDYNFDNILDDVFKDVVIKDKTVNISYTKSIAELSPNPHLIFIAPGQKAAIKNLHQLSVKENILLVGDEEEYGLEGVHINFYLTDKGTLHFTINLESVKKSNLKLNLMLIEIAKIIKEN